MSDITHHRIQWRVVCAERQEDGPPSEHVALTGTTRNSVQWMYTALRNRDDYPDVLWVRMERAMWETVAQANYPEAVIDHPNA